MRVCKTTHENSPVMCITLSYDVYINNETDAHLFIRYETGMFEVRIKINLLLIEVSATTSVPAIQALPPGQIIGSTDHPETAYLCEQGIATAASIHNSHLTSFFVGVLPSHLSSSISNPPVQTSEYMWTNSIPLVNRNDQTEQTIECLTKRILYVTYSFLTS